MICIYGGECVGCNECRCVPGAQAETEDAVFIIDFECGKTAPPLKG